LRECGFSAKECNRLTDYLTEWYSSSTLEQVLTNWENYGNHNKTHQNNKQIPLTFISYNVHGLATRGEEVLDLIHQVDASFIICTEVGEQYNSFQLPDFNMFHEKGTNKKGGVSIGIGKHLKASKVETKLPNTLVVDIIGLSEPLRVIGVYWPNSQKRNINELTPYIIHNTIISGDFNASVVQWNSPNTDKRGQEVLKWSNENFLTYIPGTTNSSKRSLRNIDLTFTNFPGVKGETLAFGTSDHRPLIYKSEHINFQATLKFASTNWRFFETILCLVQEYWSKQLEYMTTIQWYKEYIRFLAALKNRLTIWYEKEKWKPALPTSIREKLKQVREIRNRYYRSRQEEDRVCLRVGSREVKREINKYRANRWRDFLTSIQNSHGRSNTTFWKHLSKIYRPQTLPFTKLSVGAQVITSHRGITNRLSEYFSNLFVAPVVDSSNEFDNQIDSEYKEILEQLNQSKDSVKPTSVYELKNVIRTLKSKKSTGFDAVSNFMIKRLPPLYLEGLSKCFNEWMSRSLFLKEWKLAKLVILNKTKTGIPQCDQTRPISLLSTHSKIYEKLLLLRVKSWADENHIIPPEQSGFRRGCLLQTRVLSIYQEVKNNMAANVPTLGIYIDYKKAYDLVWHMGLIVKLHRMRMPPVLLKLIVNWLSNREACVSFGQYVSDPFQIKVGLPQGSALSPYIFIIYHADIVSCVEAFATHIFADDLSVLIVPPINRDLNKMVAFINWKGTQICQKLLDYSIRWKQPINVSKTVVQLFYTQVKPPIVEIYMGDKLLENVSSFKYLGFHWTNKLSLAPTVDQCLEKIQRSFIKLKWLKRNKHVTKDVLRICFFAYSFPFFAWLFPFFPMLPAGHQEALKRKFRVGIRIIHRCLSVSASDLFSFVKERPLESYVTAYLQKRLLKAYKTDLGESLFINDIFYWDALSKNRPGKEMKTKKLRVGQFLYLKRVKKMIADHESYLIRWINFIESNPR